ncbi:tyrosine-type recombinase/integrase [Nocardia asteroides]|uniref:tyrosine-type recombinase/integrase n=1 Tax=Nocardia asteroides TaxID=1824 RepID=UPI001E3BDE62|nr:site-specific integrase [Nocardia asteroides]UGT61855.1 site-specific integrase [Nocardia asteroides]
MTDRPTPAPGTAGALLAQLGLDPADVAALASRRRTMPTIAEYIERLLPTLPDTPGSRNYRLYWRRLLAESDLGSRRLDEPTATEFKALIAHLRETRVRRRNGRDGSAVESSWITALRRLYQCAEDDGLIEPHRNPARRLERPRMQPPARHALPQRVMAEINRIAAVTGSDPELDVLIIRLHTETACRRGAAMALRPRDLDPEDCVLLLREKGGLQRWHPVSPTLMRALVHHARTRCTDPDQQLLRGRSLRPVRDDRYARLWGRMSRYIPEVEAYNITTHWLRHTTLTWVERNFGYAAARAYAGHIYNQRYSSTLTYTKADLTELARVVQTLTGEPHPLLVPSQPQQTSLAGATHSTAHNLHRACQTGNRPQGNSSGSLTGSSPTSATTPDIAASSPAS